MWRESDGELLDGVAYGFGGWRRELVGIVEWTKLAVGSEVGFDERFPPGSHFRVLRVRLVLFSPAGPGAVGAGERVAAEGGVQDHVPVVGDGQLVEGCLGRLVRSGFHLIESGCPCAGSAPVFDSVKEGGDAGQAGESQAGAAKPDFGSGAAWDGRRRGGSGGWGCGRRIGIRVGWFHQVAGWGQEGRFWRKKEAVRVTACLWIAGIRARGRASAVRVIQTSLEPGGGGGGAGVPEIRARRRGPEGGGQVSGTSGEEGAWRGEGRGRSGDGNFEGR